MKEENFEHELVHKASNKNLDHTLYWQVHLHKYSNHGIYDKSHLPIQFEQLLNLLYQSHPNYTTLPRTQNILNNHFGIYTKLNSSKYKLFANLNPSSTLQSSTINALQELKYLLKHLSHTLVQPLKRPPYSAIKSFLLAPLVFNLTQLEGEWGGVYLICLVS